MNHKYAQELLIKYKSGRCTPAEKQKLEDWIAYGIFPETYITDEEVEQELKKIDSALSLKRNNRISIWIGASVTSIAAGLLMTFYFNYHLPSVKPESKQELVAVQEIAPGKVGATLTLANGQKIRLADAAYGRVAFQSGVEVSKTADGKLSYEVNSNVADRDYSNTLSTSKGETYKVSLPDGTIAYLNSASSLTYPVVFAASGKRIVKLTGEGYFEVAKDPSRPFIVETDKQKVEVLGTHFNINAYEDEPNIKTTLLEGSIKVSSHGSTKLLTPGQQSTLINGAIQVNNIDLEEPVAWKNDQIILGGQDVPTIMRMISRWYDVDIKYDGEISKELYYAKISRFDNMNKLLKLLEKAQGIHFKVEGRTVIVSK
ncbi:FecR family protein [Sphingobacterium sp. LRF_L2]|uniref:FecR family protein n=1 Tax=Sphingobacterium sp. LRF_L2 TaxID=3369421 RepID=UPI003F63E9C6